ncbi:lysosomal-associated transmembrane protein 5 isoform X2 [Dendropsophus ebraccatus]|uniref:lysosomal-associated transmembrane protein 5 isoform X2 n=1 Tax=Dendropsophus ebraccatus TaxID=150705 RepID=UPI003831A713
MYRAQSVTPKMFSYPCYTKTTVTQQKLHRATNMATEQTKGIEKPRGLKVRCLTYIWAVYHLGVSIILFIEYTIEMDKKKNFSVELCNFNNIGVVSSYLLLVVLFLISLSLLIGVRLNHGSLVMPFLALQTMDFILSFLIFFTDYSQVPLRQENFIQSNMAVSKLDAQSTQWGYFQMCLRMMISCSCYVELPTYLNLKPTNYIPYFLVSVSSEKYIKKMIVFSVLHAAVISYKAFMICCVWRFFKSTSALMKNQSNEKPSLQEISKVALPSYKEALKMESKDPPPPYTTV